MVKILRGSFLLELCGSKWTSWKIWWKFFKIFEVYTWQWGGGAMLLQSATRSAMHSDLVTCNAGQYKSFFSETLAENSTLPKARPYEPSRQQEFRSYNFVCSVRACASNPFWKFSLTLNMTACRAHMARFFFDQLVNFMKLPVARSLCMAIAYSNTAPLYGDHSKMFWNVLADFLGNPDYQCIPPTPNYQIKIFMVA